MTSLHHICLLLMMVTIESSEGAEDDKVIYSRIGDSVDFGKISSLDQSPDIDEAVWHIEEDKSDDEILIIADGSAIKSFNYNYRPLELNTIIGDSQSQSYQEGVYPGALFNSITGFVQVNWTHILAVDSNNHCLRFVDRSRNMTSSYAGLCQTPGHIDGDRTASRFNKPLQMVIRPDHVHIYLTDTNNKAIREINLGTQRVSTWTTLSHTPIAITLDRQGKNIYVSTPYDVVIFDQKTGSREPLLHSTAVGFQDGDFNVAMLNHPYGILSVSKDALLLAETNNNRLRVLNLLSQTVTSICNGNAEFTDGAASVNSCELEQPLSLVFLMSPGVVMIGTNTTEMRTLEIGRGRRNRLPKSSPPPPRPTGVLVTSSSDQGRSPMPKVDSIIVVSAVITAGVVVIAVVIAVALLLHRKYVAHKQRHGKPTANLDKAVANAAIQNKKYAQAGVKSELGHRASNPYGEYTEMEETYQTLDYSEIGLYSPVDAQSGQSGQSGQMSSKPKESINEVTSGLDNQYHSAEQISTISDDETSSDSPPLTKREDYGYLQFDHGDSIHESLKSDIDDA